MKNYEQTNQDRVFISSNFRGMQPQARVAGEEGFPRAAEGMR